MVSPGEKKLETRETLTRAPVFVSRHSKGRSISKKRTEKIESQTKKKDVVSLKKTKNSLFRPSKTGEKGREELPKTPARRQRSRGKINRIEEDRADRARQDTEPDTAKRNVRARTKKNGTRQKKGREEQHTGQEITIRLLRRTETAQPLD